MADLAGACMCGAVRWRHSGPVMRSLVCHCTDCQKATSAPFTAFVGVDPERLEWTGTPNHYQSSPGTYRGFCPDCGTRLYFRSEKWPGEIHMHAATLDDQSGYHPTAQVVLRSRAKWLDELDGLPRHRGFEAPPEGEA